MTNMEALLGIFAAFILVFAAIGFVFYIFLAVGLMGIAKQTGTSGGWMAWLPIFNIYLIGKLGINKVFGWALVVLLFLGGTGNVEVNGETVATGSLLPAPFNTIASLIMGVLLILSLHKIYKRVSDKAVVMTIFSILSFGLLVPIFLFAIRKNPVIA